MSAVTAGVEIVIEAVRGYDVDALAHMVEGDVLASYPTQEGMRVRMTVPGENLAFACETLEDDDGVEEYSTAASEALLDELAQGIAQGALSEGLLGYWSEGSHYVMTEADCEWCCERGGAGSLGEIQDRVTHIIVCADEDAKAEYAQEVANG